MSSAASASISRLPAEVLESIFLFALQDCNPIWFARTIPRVCRWWRYVAFLNRAIRCTEVRSGHWKQATQQDFKDTLTLFDRWPTIELEQKITPGLLCTLAEACSPFVTTLDLGTCEFPKSYSFPTFPHVKALMLDDTDLRNGHLEAINRQFPSLQKLNVSFCWKLTATGMMHLSNLTAIDISGLGSHLRGSVSSVCAVLSTNHPRLRELIATDASMIDRDLQQICNYLQNLAILNVSGNTELTSYGLMFAGNLKQLRLFDCTNVYFFDDRAAFGLSQCSELESLGMCCNSNLTETGCRVLAAGCPKLLKIKVEDSYLSYPVNNAGCAIFLKEFANVAQFQSVYLSGCYMPKLTLSPSTSLTMLHLEDVEELDNNALPLITTGFPSLQSLSIIACSNITTWSVTHTKNLVRVSRHLQCLALSAKGGQFRNCGFANADFSVARSMNKLCRLHVEKNCDFTSHGVKSLFHNNARLICFEAQLCRGIQNDAAVFLKMIRHLNMNQTAITHDFFVLLLNNGTSPLVELAIKGTRLCKDTLDLIARVCTNLECLNGCQSFGVKIKVMEATSQRMPSLVRWT